MVLVFHMAMSLRTAAPTYGRLHWILDFRSSAEQFSADPAAHEASQRILAKANGH
jgi:hypothetical protein